MFTVYNFWAHLNFFWWNSLLLFSRGFRCFDFCNKLVKLLFSLGCRFWWLCTSCLRFSSSNSCALGHGIWFCSGKNVIIRHRSVSCFRCRCLFLFSFFYSTISRLGCLCFRWGSWFTAWGINGSSRLSSCSRSLFCWLWRSFWCKSKTFGRAYRCWRVLPIAK